MSTHKILKIAPANLPLQDKLHKELGISKIIAQLLINRGITTTLDAEKFLKINLNNLLDPFQFSDMQRAVSLIEQAAKNKKKIMIFGDYDVDGITSVAVLKNTLEKRGFKPLHHIPHRINDGYGLNKNVVQIAKEKNVDLLITVDCGSSSFEEVKHLKASHIEVIITDHHQPAHASLPPADAIINPKIQGCNYKYKDLAGVGVAYKLCQALTKESLGEELDLVSLGTIADVVPLTGENRIIAKLGLAKLTQAKRVGIKSLIDVSRIGKKEINATFVSFILAPRLNASGRMDTAECALNLLLSDKKVEADILAQSIDTLNRQRQKIESSIMEEAQAMIEREVNFKEHKVIVVAQSGWHQGILGIVAAKLADKFYRPTIVISLGEKLCKGSGRSIKNFHLFSALVECEELLHAFGGHSHAVGLTIERSKVDEFRRKLNHLAKEKLFLEDLLPSLDVDMEVDLAALSEELADEISVLEPFGTANPEPLFYTRNLRLKGQPQVLSRDTLKFFVTDGKNTHPVIGFGMGSFCSSLINSTQLEIVYTPRIDNWLDKHSLILEAKEIFFN